MIQKIYITCFLIITSINLQSQNVDNILSEIENNNKSILANMQYWEAKKLQYQTGLTLNNPSVEFEYLNGSPEGAGNQTDLLILQSFDFPTAYVKKRQVTDLQIEQINFILTASRQNILLEAKQYYIELVYLNKKMAEINKRLRNAESLHNVYQKKMENGDANILDVNKAKLQLINLKNDKRLNRSQMNQIDHMITQLNGGYTISIIDISYPVSPDIPDFQILENDIKESDPILKTAQQQEEIDQKKIELSKAMSLPKMEAGYRSQALLGQNFQGVHVGFTIPLWENKNTVKFQKAQSTFSEVKTEEHKNRQFTHIQSLHEKYLNLHAALTEYKQLLATVNNTELLDKALKLGEISSIQYFLEINYLYSSFDKYLQLEKEYYSVIAELYKYKL